MLRRGLNLCRAHPILVALALGALVGAANVLVIEVGGFRQGGSGGVLSLFMPTTRGVRSGQAGAPQTAMLLAIELVGNVIGFAFLFAVPVAVVVGIRRIFGRGKRAASLEERP